MDVHLERLAVLDHVEAFDQVQLVGMRRLIVVDIGLAGDSDRIDLMYGWAGSDTIGPGPLGGWMNSSSRSCQPVKLSGAKFGTFVASAPSVGHSPAPAQTKLTMRPLTSALITGTPPNASFGSNRYSRI
jgi:hypothetical protein